MTLGFKKLLARIAWNALMIAVVYLPVFLGLAAFDLILQQDLHERDFARTVGDMAFYYIFMMIPLIASSFTYSLVLLVVPVQWSSNYRRVAAVLLSPLVPATVILLDLPWAPLLQVHFATIIATTTYGMFTKV